MALNSFSALAFRSLSLRAVIGEIVEVTNWWPLVGGYIDRYDYPKIKKQYEDTPEEVKPIIEAIAKETPKAPVTQLRKELKRNDIEYNDAYKSMLKSLIKAQIAADRERDDEEVLLMLM